MSESQENKPLEMFNLPAQMLATIRSSDGQQRARVPFGHVRLKVKNISQKMQSGERQYLQAIVDSEIVRHDSNPDAVGMTIRSWYAADANAHPYMLSRTKAFLDAVKANVTAAGVSVKEIIGREYDATVIWDTSTRQDTKDPMNVSTKTFVNDKVIGERAVGSPTEIDPKAASQKAIAHLSGDGSAQPWEQKSTAPQAATPQQVADAPAEETSGGDDGAEWTEDAYRALIVMNHPAAEQAREALTQAGIAIDGPIDETKLPGDIKTKYAVFKTKQAGGLPALSLGKKGKKNSAASTETQNA